MPLKMGHKKKLSDLSSENCQNESKRARFSAPSANVVAGLRGNSSSGRPIDYLTQLAEAGIGDGILAELLAPEALCTSQDVLGPLGSSTTTKVKSSEVAVVFSAVDRILLAVGASEPEEKKRLSGLAVELTRVIMQKHHRYVVLLLSPSNSVRQRRATLKMLAAMAACSPATAKEVLLKLDFEHKHFELILKPVKNKAKTQQEESDPHEDRSDEGEQSLRTCLIYFYMAFFVSGNAAIARELLEKRSKLALIFQDLVRDSPQTISLVLATLKAKLIENSGVSKTSKMKLFSVNNLKPLLPLLTWKGPNEQNGVSEDLKESMAMLVHFPSAAESIGCIRSLAADFFRTLLTSFKLGVVFSDPSCGNSGLNQNHLLLNLLKAMSKPWDPDQGALGDIVIEVLTTCPDQIRPYFNTLESLWSPRDSVSWHQLVDFLRLLFEKLNLSGIVSQMTQTKMIATTLANLMLSERLCKTLVLPALRSESAPVRRQGIALFHTSLSKLLEAAATVRAEPRRQTLVKLSERLPTGDLLHRLWSSEVTLVSEECQESQADWGPLEDCVRLLHALLLNFRQRYIVSVDLQKMSSEIKELGESNAMVEQLMARLNQLLQEQHLAKESGDQAEDDSENILKYKTASSVSDEYARLVSKYRVSAQCAPAKGSPQKFKTIADLIKRLVKSIKALEKCAESEQVEHVPKLSEITSQLVHWSSSSMETYAKDNQDEWLSFVRTALTFGLKATIHIPARVKTLEALSQIATAVYSDNPGRQGEAGTIYDLILNHEEFRDTVMDGSPDLRPVKEHLLRTAIVLIQANPSVCSANHLPTFLGAYGGTLSAADQCLFEILRLYESAGDVNFVEYKPLLWGEAARSHYSVQDSGKATRTLGLQSWRKAKASEVLALIESKKMARSALELPLKLTMRHSEDNLKLNDLLRYDPRFFLSVFSSLCAPGAFIDRHTQFVESGALALAIAATSSRDKELRQCGYLVLARIADRMEVSKIAMEKKVWLRLIDLFRQGILASGSATPSSLRIPPVVASFLAKASLVLASPLDPMYKALSSFLLAKPLIDLFRVPELYRMIFSKDVKDQEVEQSWILATVRDGFKDDLDYSVCEKDFLIKVLLALYGSSLCKPAVQALIRAVLLRHASIPSVAFDLVRSHDFLLFLYQQISQETESRKMIDLVAIMTTLWNTMQNSILEQRKKVTGAEEKQLAIFILRHFALCFSTALSKADLFIEDEKSCLTLMEVLGQLLEEARTARISSVNTDKVLMVGVNSAHFHPEQEEKFVKLLNIASSLFPVPNE